MDTYALDGGLKKFLTIPYDQLESMNIQAQTEAETLSEASLKKKFLGYLADEKLLKAVTVCFADIEGRLHLLDYDKKYFLAGYDNLTFDGSSIHGFSKLRESDLRLSIDWGSVRWLPADVFGPGKVVVFATILTPDRQPFESDFRGKLIAYLKELKAKKALVPMVSAEVEGFLVSGVDAEQHYREESGFSLISSGGYFHSLPLDDLRKFIDRAAEAQRAMGFKNEKDHYEVAPSQFELNFAYANAVRAADNILLYKLVCRQVANSMGMTATFLPKPIVGINGSGMHLNVSLAKGDTNLFYDARGEAGLSATGWGFVERLLFAAPDICLVLNSSVNAYRRLDPHFEAPNQIKASAIDRGSMIRIPAGNSRSARIEIRSVAPDTNPYLALLTILRVGLEGKLPPKRRTTRERVRFLPGTLADAIRLFKSSLAMREFVGAVNQEKYVQYKQIAADRSPRELGNRVKMGEVIYHHEVTNQVLWNSF